jgi:hypothetical protein
VNLLREARNFVSDIEESKYVAGVILGVGSDGKFHVAQEVPGGLLQCVCIVLLEEVIDRLRRDFMATDNSGDVIDV